MRGEGHVTGVVVDAHFLAVLGGEGHGHAVEFAADFVGVFVVVAVAGSRAEELLDVFVAFEVGFESVDELIHGELLVFKHELLDGGQGVDDGAEAHEFKVAEVQAFGDLGLMQVDAVLAAESVQHGAHGLGEVLGAGLDNNVLLDERGTEQEHVLLHVGVPEFVPALELAGVAGLDAELHVAVLLHLAVVQSHFHSGGEVGVSTAGGVGVAVGHTDFDAAGHGVVKGFFKGRALGDVQRDAFFVVAQLGEAGAELDGFGDVPQVAFRSAAVDTGGEVGVVQREFALGLQEQVGQIVGRVAAVRGLTADGDGFPVSVTFVEGAAGGGDVHVDEFGHADPHAFQVFQGLFIGQDAGFHVLLVEGIEVLVHTAVGDGGTGLLFQTGEHLGEVLGLNGFVEVASRVGGHVFGVFSHADEFGLADRIGASFGGLAGGVGVALRPQNDGVAHEDGGFDEGTLVHLIHGGGGIKSGQFFFHFLLQAVEAALQHHFVVMHPLDGGAERGGFVDDEAGDQAVGIVVGQLVDFGGKSLVQSFVIGAALPERSDLLNHDLGVFGADGSRRLRAGWKVAHGDVEEVAVEFGVQDAVTAVMTTAAAEEELVVLHHDGDVLGNVHQSLGPAENQRLTHGFGHGLREVQSAFDVDSGLLAVETFQQLEHALVGFAIDVFFTGDVVFETLLMRRFDFSYLSHVTSPCRN